MMVLPVVVGCDESSWTVRSGSDLVAYADGSFTVLADDENFVYLSPTTSVSMPNEYKIELSLSFVPGSNNAGVAIHWDLGEKTKCFKVSPEGYWKLDSYDGEDWNTIQPWIQTDILPSTAGEVLEIEILVLPHTAVFSVNGKEIQKVGVRGHALSLKPFAIDVDFGVHATFSNFQITEVSQEESTAIEADLQLEREAAIVQLDYLVGMDDIKQQIRSMANVIRVQQRRQALGLETQTQSNHMVISGPPGTGKTTVARVLGGILKSLGVLSKGHVVETDRGGLVGEYIGQTAPRVKEKVKQAQGGILFVDEAYMLKPQDVSAKDLGQEAIDTLMKEMEDKRDDLVVVIAGYKGKLEPFLASNPGITSRFKHHFNFNDFLPGELTEIFRRSIQSSGYTITDEAMKAVSSHLEIACQNKTESFGNGRYVRNMIEMMVNNMANRLADGSLLDETEVSQFEKPDVPTKLLPGASERPSFEPAPNTYL